MEKYVYCEPMGGWNDVMVNIKIALMFCKRHRRRLLVNGEKNREIWVNGELSRFGKPNRSGRN